MDRSNGDPRGQMLAMVEFRAAHLRWGRRNAR